ncbi:hypothetical protein [Altererythrobacter sp.]|uniref:hypothetical protein n=1 Tax=Altererythrobacter sp. TaxID=1872480 RepID=UPI003D0053F4
MHQSARHRIETVDFLREAWRLMVAASVPVIVVVGLLSLIGFGIDYVENASLSDQAYNIASFITGYYLTIEMLRKGGLLGEGLKAGIWTYFGISLLSGLAILFGALLLIIPGLVLLMRWLPAYGIALAEGTGVIESLEKSWGQTQGHFAALFIAFLVPVSMMVIGLGIYFLPELISDPMVDIFSVVLANILLATFSATMTALGIASYSLLGGRFVEVSEVFS